MILYKDAIHCVTSSASLLSSEKLKAESSLGRVLSQEIISPESLPPFANSAMDGFAISFEKPLSLPFRKRVNGIIAAGDALNKHRTATNECWEIMTGAPVPSDCDTVVKIEDVQRDGEWVEFSKSVLKGQHIRKAGEDILSGNKIISSGTRLLPEHIMAFAALGIKEVAVRCRPTVAVLSTGAELNDDSNTENGKIRNSTAPYLLNELTSLQLEKKFLGVVADDPKAFLKLMESELTNNTDVILSTGAVSMGRYDFIASALRELGAEILFHKVAIRPGKPLLFAKIGKTAFFGIPGNPISTVVGLRFFVEPYLRAIQGVEFEKPYRALLENPFNKPAGGGPRQVGQLSIQRTQRTVRILPEQESFRVAPLLTAQCWAVLPEEGNFVEAQSEIDIYPLHSYTQKELL